jgi:coatomer subunit beta
MSATNMGCLTPEGALSGDCDFLSANLYARSLFGACPALAVSSTQLLTVMWQARTRWRT